MFADKIKKLLALSDKAGTEAEAIAAMEKAQSLLAKHGLTMADVQGNNEDKSDEFSSCERTDSVGSRPWKRFIWSGIAELYFCQYVSYGTRRHVLIGTSINVEICYYLIDHIIATGERLAYETAQHEVAKDRRYYLNSFKNAYGLRIYKRCKENIELAKKEGIKDTSTGSSLVVQPLYDSAQSKIKDFLKNQNIRTRTTKTRMTSRSQDGWNAGTSQADSVSLHSNGINDSGGVTKKRNKIS